MKILNILLEVGETEEVSEFIEIPINTQDSNKIKKLLSEKQKEKLERIFR
jgi:hypothetical protein